jgi:PAS domain S-box-containing protein
MQEMNSSKSPLRSLPWQMAVSICLLILCIAATLVYSLWASQQKALRHISQVEAAMQITQQDILGHNMLRYAFAEDNQDAFDQAVDHFERSNWFVQAMLEGAESVQGRIAPVRDPELSVELSQMRAQRKEFLKILNQRWAEHAPGARLPGLSAAQKVQHTFVEQVQKTDAVQALLHAKINADLRSFRLTQYALAGLIILLLIISVYTSWRFMRQRDAAYKAAEEQRDRLHQREAALQNLFNDAPIGIFRTTSNGRTLKANPELQKMLRIDTQAQGRVYRRDLHNTLYGNTAQRSEFLRRLDTEGQVEQFEIQGRRADGTWGWFSLNARISKRHSNQSFTIDGFMSEITHQKKAQENLEHLNRVLRAIRDINHLSMSETDRWTLIQRGCRVLVQSRGFEAGMIILTDQSRRPVQYAQEGLNESVVEYDLLLQQGEMPECCRQAMEHSEICLINKPSMTCDGCPMAESCMDSDTLCLPLEHMGTMYGTLIVVLPRSEGRDHEEQGLLCELASDIAFALYAIERDEDARKAEEAKETAERHLAQAQKMEAVGRLAGGVAHDFNNMLGVIMGYADMTLRKVQEDESLHYPLEQIKQAAERSADLTRQLLAFSRRQLSQARVIDLNTEIARQKELLDRLIGETIVLSFYPASGLWPIRVDPSQIDQILANMVINARDAITGDGRITMETMNVVLDQTYTEFHSYVQPGEYVCLTVSDTGTGMDQETMDQIFDPFFSTKQADQGTGLGLSTVYGIVKQNQGVVHVYSEQGRGSTFKIYFPRSQGEVSADEGSRNFATVSGEETVLLVEDEEMVLDLTQAVLEEQGYTVLATRSPSEARKLAGEYAGPIHVLLTDVILPETNGKELKTCLEAIRPGIKTLFMSGYTHNVIAQQGIVDSRIHFIQKPFSAAGLSQKLREVLASQ